jgi:hypothetical protein
MMMMTAICCFFPDVMALTLTQTRSRKKVTESQLHSTNGHARGVHVTVPEVKLV